MTFEKEFKGNVTEDKFERVKAREDFAKEEEMKQKIKNAKNPFNMSPGKI